MASRMPNYPEPVDAESSAEHARPSAPAGGPLMARETSAQAQRPAAAPPPAGHLRDFLTELLVEQQRLQTPVAQFSALHDFSPAALRSFSPSRLIPLSQPRASEQYAFEVDLDACTGCKSCVSACHALNGLDETETWRDTGQLLGCGSSGPVAQTITTACHHCEDPGCLNGCPVLAYEKDPLTGIVRHLDDQCIGCQYCILKCPYDVPKYNARLGIVRKCDLCHQRLAHGEAPACAQACPTQAIRIVVVSTGKSASAPDRWSPLAPAATNNSRRAPHASTLPVVAEDSDDHPGAAGPFRDESEIACRGAVSLRPSDAGVSNRAQQDCAPTFAGGPESKIVQRAAHQPNRKAPIPFPGPDPAYTRPTTRYVTARELPSELRAADVAALRPQHAHWPLVLMLTLLPWAIVLQTLLLTPLAALPPSTAPLDGGAPVPTPSELSGIVAYHVTMPPGLLALLPLALGALGLAAATFHLGQPLRAWRVFLGLRTSWFSREAVLFGGWFGLTALAAVFPRLPAVNVLAAATGLAGLVCSVMIYVDTRRAFWRPAFTAPRFFLGGAVLALATLAAATAAVAASARAEGIVTNYVTMPLGLALTAKLAVEFASLVGESVSARLQRKRLVGVLCVRLGLAAVAVAALVAPAVAAAEPVMAYYARFAVVLGALVAGEIAERYLFFCAVDAPKMPGYATR